MINNKKIICYIFVCCTSVNFAAPKKHSPAIPTVPTRAGFCRPGSAPCACIQQNKFIQLATASHGAPVNAVSWCCQPTFNSIGNPAIHLAIAGDPSYGILPGEITSSVIYIRIYELDLVTQKFVELNSYLINAQLPGTGTAQPELHALDWCCLNGTYFLIAGGNNLAFYPDPLIGPNVADVAVFAFDDASWMNPSTTRIPFALGKTGYYYYTFGATVYAVSALCNPCPNSSIQFYLAMGGNSTSNGYIAGSRKQISIVTFIFN
jgi:hypothetical protein